jgi:hypothetical protein
MCPPLLSGRYPTSSLIWGYPTSYGSSGFLPVCRLCHPTSFPGRTHRTSRVPGSALVTCPGLRPRWVQRSPSHIGSLDVAFRLANGVGTHGFTFITGLNPFTHAHYGPSPPCVRFAAAVTDDDATRGTRCLARASGAGTCLRLTKPSFDCYTNPKIPVRAAYSRKAPMPPRRAPPGRCSRPIAANTWTRPFG